MNTFNPCKRGFLGINWVEKFKVDVTVDAYITLRDKNIIIYK